MGVGPSWPWPSLGFIRDLNVCLLDFSDRYYFLSSMTPDWVSVSRDPIILVAIGSDLIR